MSVTTRIPVEFATCDPTRLAAIRLVATDIDGTLTVDDGPAAAKGRLDPRVLQAFVQLREAGVEVLPVTGRPAGEALGLIRYLPGVARAIAENGATLVQPEQPVEFLTPEPDRSYLLKVSEELSALGSPWRLAPDHFCRLGDLAWQRDGRSDIEIADLARHAAQRQLHLIWSNVHIHLSPHAPDKGHAVLQLAEREGILPQQIASIGDAPNDAGLWQPGRFGVAVGTQQVMDQLDFLPFQPEFVVARASQGWLQLAKAILAAK